MIKKIPPSTAGTYKLVKYCRLCKVRMVLPKGESRRYYCDACEKKAQAYREGKEKD